MTSIQDYRIGVAISSYANFLYQYREYVNENFPESETAHILNNLWSEYSESFEDVFML